MNKEKYIIHFLAVIYFAIFANIWFPGTGASGLVIPQNNISLWFLSIFVLLVSYSVLAKRKAYVPLTTIYIVTGLLISILPFVFGKVISLDIGFYSILILITGLCFYLAIFQLDFIREKPELLLYVILIPVSVQLCHGLYDSLQAVYYHVKVESALFNPAPKGVFNQRNVFSSFIASGLAISLYLIALNPFNKWSKEILAALCVLSFFAGFLIVLTLSRTIYIGLFLSVLLLSPMAIQKCKKRYILWIMSMFMGVASALVLYKVLPISGKEMFVAGPRGAIYQTSFNLFKDAPLIGHGLGSFQSVFIEYYASLSTEFELAPTTDMGHPHNELLLWLIEGGLVSVTGILILVYGYFSVFFKRLTVESLALLGLLMPISLHVLTELPFYHSFLHLFTYIMMLAYSFLALSKEGGLKIFKLKKKTKISNVVYYCLGLVLTIIFSVNIASINTVLNFYRSDTKQIQELDNVIITLGWERYFDGVYKGVLMETGKDNGIRQFIEEYIDWAEAEVKVSPRAHYYQNLYMAYAYIGDLQKLKYTADRIRYYYPYDKRLMSWLNNSQEQ